MENSINNRRIDPSFTAENFIPFTALKETNDSVGSLQDIWLALPDAIKIGNLDEQLTWQGKERKLMRVFYPKMGVAVLKRIAVAFTGIGLAVIVMSYWYNSSIIPMIGLYFTLSGVAAYIIALVCNKLRAKTRFSMHTHGVFVWGKIESAHKLKKLIGHLA